MKTTSLVMAIGLLGLTATGLYAQVGINNTATSPDPSAILDLKTGNTGVNKGFLPQSVALTNVTVAAPVTSPATGLIVYSSTAPAGGTGIGYYYWTGTAWASMGGGGTVGGSGKATRIAYWNNASGITGDSDLFWDKANLRLGVGTSVPFEALDVHTYTTPNIAKFGYSSPLCIVANEPMLGFNAYWNGTETYYSSNYAGMIEYDQLGTGEFRFMTAPAGTALTAATMITAMTILNNGRIGIATGTPSSTLQVLDNGNFQTGEFDNSVASGTALIGSATGSGDSWGVSGASTSASGYGVYAQNTAVSGSGTGSGLYASTAQSSGYGIQGVNSYTPGSYLGAGIAIDGIGGGAGHTSFLYGQGVYGEGTNIGVMGYATGASGIWPVYGSNDNGARWAALAYYNGTDYKVIGSGTVSTIVKDENNQPRIMNCPEAPEILFEDYGTATLSGGKVHVDLDPVYAKNVTINEKHPLRVMITLNGQCNGVYVTNRTATGFDVVELGNGTSNASFTYEVIANRADVYDANGNPISKNADSRFAEGPAPLQVSATGAVTPPAKPAVPAFVPAPRVVTAGTGVVSTQTQK